MKITLLKPYLNHTAGDTIEVNATRGSYLIKTKQAKQSGEKKQAYVNKPNDKKRKPKSK